MKTSYCGVIGWPPLTPECDHNRLDTFYYSEKSRDKNRLNKSKMYFRSILDDIKVMR